MSDLRCVSPERSHSTEKPLQKNGSACCDGRYFTDNLKIRRKDLNQTSLSPFSLAMCSVDCKEHFFLQQSRSYTSVQLQVASTETHFQHM